MRTVEYLRGLGVEAYLNNFVPKAPVNQDWDVDKAAIGDLVVRWPAEYEWNEASSWVEVLKMCLKRHVRVETVNDIPQKYKGTVVVEMVRDGQKRTVAIGYSDYLVIDQECADGADLYFKMQYDKSGYGRENVVAGGYVPDGKRLYFHLKELRKLRDARNYQFDVAGRFSLNYAAEIRKKATTLLAEQTAFAFEGGMKTVSYIEFLREAARSRICLDLPGLGPLCFRLINYLAIGSCIVAYPHKALLNVPLVDRKHIVYCREDLSDLPELCEFYLAHTDEREEIARNAREFFDLYLHKDNLVRYYLSTCLSRLW